MALVAVLSTIVAFALARSPLLLLGATSMGLLISSLLLIPNGGQKLFLTSLGSLLTGYAFFGKGFAYLPAAPIFFGEIVLFIGLVAVLSSGIILPILQLRFLLLITAFGVWGVLCTVPFVSRYGLFALRDAVVWGYALFALLVAGFLLKSDGISAVVRAYGRWVPWCLFSMAVVFGLQTLAFDWLPVVSSGDSKITFPYLKGGDIAVHLAGAGCFIVLRLHRDAAKGPKHGREWIWWVFWFAALIAPVTGRGGLLAILAAFLLLLVLKPTAQWGKPALAGVVLATALAFTGAEIDVGSPRKISINQIAQNARSLLGASGDSRLEGTRAWRLAWWRKIVDYTLFGEHFWTGKGFGVNLADDDGFQGSLGHSLRSPHNGHLTILARMGVPGLALWLLLQGGFAFGLLRAHFRAKRARREWWARVNLWILAYWTAFMVNGMFDVFLEGPQGGIWFWCLFGFGIAALEIQKRERRAWAIEQRGASLSYLESPFRSQPLSATRW